MNRFMVPAAMSVMVFALTSCARPHIEYNGTVHEGEATYYEDGRLGNCSFPPEIRPALHAAMNKADYAGSRSCGTYVNVRRKDDPQQRHVTVFIDNQCPECAAGDIDLSPAAFERIAERIEGRVPVEWSYVPAPEKRPLRFRWKEDSGKWWFQVLVMDHQYAIARVEVQESCTDWVTLRRMAHNYWEARHGVERRLGPFNIRVTDVRGNKETVFGVPVEPGQIVSGEQLR